LAAAGNDNGKGTEVQSISSEHGTSASHWGGTYPYGWLSAIESLTKEVSTCRQIPKPKPSGRSEFEMIIWLPEAALPFFKGLDYYSRGDYALAVPWFRHSYKKPGIPALGIVRCLSIHIGTVSTILPALILLIFGRVKLDTARPHKSY
jgi:hypothetical protein